VRPFLSGGRLLGLLLLNVITTLLGTMYLSASIPLSVRPQDLLHLLCFSKQPVKLGSLLSTFPPERNMPIDDVTQDVQSCFALLFRTKSSMDSISSLNTDAKV
jgi:hypothetical protein